MFYAMYIHKKIIVNFITLSYTHISDNIKVPPLLLFTINVPDGVDITLHFDRLFSVSMMIVMTPNLRIQVLNTFTTYNQVPMILLCTVKKCRFKCLRHLSDCGPIL